MASNMRIRASSGYGWPAAFHRDLTQDDARTAALWQRFEQTRGLDVRNALVEHYLPLTTITAMRLKKGRPDFYRDGLEEMISDGCLALIDAIGTKRDCSPAMARAYFIRAIRTRIPCSTIVRRSIVLATYYQRNDVH